MPLVIADDGTLDANGLRASGRCELDIRTLGLSAPRFLMWKVELDRLRAKAQPK